MLSADQADIVLSNRNMQLERIASRLAAKETALQRIMDAVTLTEAKRLVSMPGVALALYLYAFLLLGTPNIDHGHYAVMRHA